MNERGNEDGRRNVLATTLKRICKILFTVCILRYWKMGFWLGLGGRRSEAKRCEG